MRAISLWQPWATAIALGVKQVETRHWKTDYRGPIAIHAENLADRDRKGRAALGSRQGASKLTEEQARIVWRSDAPAQQLANRFGVHYTTILKIKQGVNWKHVH